MEKEIKKEYTHIEKILVKNLDFETIELKIDYKNDYKKFLNGFRHFWFKDKFGSGSDLDLEIFDYVDFIDINNNEYIKYKVVDIDDSKMIKLYEKKIKNYRKYGEKFDIDEVQNERDYVTLILKKDKNNLRNENIVYFFRDGKNNDWQLILQSESEEQDYMDSCTFVGDDRQEYLDKQKWDSYLEKSFKKVRNQKKILRKGEIIM